MKISLKSNKKHINYIENSKSYIFGEISIFRYILLMYVFLIEIYEIFSGHVNWNGKSTTGEQKLNIFCCFHVIDKNLNVGVGFWKVLKFYFWRKAIFTVFLTRKTRNGKSDPLIHLDFIDILILWFLWKFSVFSRKFKMLRDKLVCG